ncbi:hypothetical protein U1Q18_028196 [Sarracenia purpurea var. burkii]
MTESSSYKDYLAGLLAGVATVVTGHPFDTVKELIMAQRGISLLSITAASAEDPQRYRKRIEAAWSENVRCCFGPRFWF